MAAIASLDFPKRPLSSSFYTTLLVKDWRSAWQSGCTLTYFTASVLLILGGTDQGGRHSNRSCTCTRDCSQNFGQVAKVENLSSQRVKANFQLVKIGPKVDFRWVWPHSFEVGQGSRPTFRCGQEVKA